MSEPITVTDDGPVRVLRFNRPEKKNAITQAMYVTLADALVGAQARAETRVVLILGQPGIFTAGNDLNDFIAAATATGGSTRPSLRFLEALARNAKPLVAGVDGQAVGIGTTILFHCDVVIASDRTRLTAPFVDLGIVPEAASTLLAPRIIGHQRAFALLVRGEPMDAAAGLAAGLINRVVAADALEAAAFAEARALAAKPPGAVALARRLLKGDPEEIVARITEEGRIFTERLKSPEAMAAFQAFFTRR